MMLPKPWFEFSFSLKIRFSVLMGKWPAMRSSNNVSCPRLNGFCFFQAEDGIRDLTVTGVQTCALPILRHLASKNNYARIDDMHHICQGYRQVLVHILRDAPGYRVTRGCQAEYLFSSDTLGSRSRNAANSALRLRIFDRQADHRARDGLRRGDSLQVSIAATGTLWPLLFDQHMPDFAGGR